MLSHEWRELEMLCERIAELRHRYTAAQKTKNVGLIESLQSDLTLARRHRELLVQHISARLGSAAGEHDGTSRSKGAAAEDEDAEDLVGFSES
jgi:hypothetical protein